MSRSYNVAILGATGAVGSEFLAILQERTFPLRQLKLLASERSAGQTVQFGGETLTIEAVSDTAFEGVDLVLASAGASVSRQWAPVAVRSGAVVVDNSSAFRLDPDVPLVVPEVNPGALASHRGIIANPNCTTILMNVVVWPLHQVQPVRRMVISTYQSASGAGAKAMQEVLDQSRAILAGEAPKAEVLPYPLAFNLFLHNSDLDDRGYCTEEMKIARETQKIFNAPEIRITATSVRVPVLRAHSEAVNIEFHAPFDLATAREVLDRAPGVQRVEDFAKNYFPMPIAASGKDEVLVGRIRQDISEPNAIELWLCGDQIRKGAALNAVQIAERLIADDLLRVSAE